ncbi:hypothetical protein ACHAQA_006391 [Verticillium albo-atrum]
MASYRDKRSPDADIATPDDAGPRRRTPTFKALLKIVLSLAAIYFLYNSLPLIKIPGSDFLAQAEAYGSYDESERFECKPFDPIKRYSLDYGCVACWQDGGVWIKELTPVEMSSLGVDRFQDTDRASEQADEDAFCARLRMHGASFWKLPSQWPENVLWCESIDDCAKPAKNVSFEVGFPTGGGVWVLDMTQGWERLRPKILGLRNALTMDERCEVIKDVGGVFCEDPQVCAEMARLSIGLESEGAVGSGVDEQAWGIS